MKRFKLILAFVLCAGFLFSITSCLVVNDTGGSKKGLSKNSNNPHHPHSTNPGKGHGKKK